MVFISLEDFYKKADTCNILSRTEEILCAKKMLDGDKAAREKLIQSYIPTVKKHVECSKAHLKTLGLVLYMVSALEKSVDSFDFLQESETFEHRLSWALRQAKVNYIVK